MTSFKNKLLLIFTLLFIVFNYNTWSMESTEKKKHAIVYLISNPRASMVEFLRMMGTRGDFKVMHIPANYAYCHAIIMLKLLKAGIG